MKVLGIQEMKGVSKKTGKPYDSVVLYVTGEAKDVVGCITDNIWVPRDVWDSQVGEPVSDAFIGMDVYPAYDRRGFFQVYLPVCKLLRFFYVLVYCYFLYMFVFLFSDFHFTIF